MKMIKPYRGDVWIVQLDPTRGREQTKTRPCIIISTDSFNQGPSQLVIVIPLTTKFNERHRYISLNRQESGVHETSYVLCEQIRVVSLERLHGERLGAVSPEILLKIEFRIKALLGFS